MARENRQEKIERLQDQCKIEFRGDWSEFLRSLKHWAEKYHGQSGMNKHLGRIGEDLPTVLWLKKNSA